MVQIAPASHDQQNATELPMCINIFTVQHRYIIYNKLRYMVKSYNSIRHITLLYKSLNHRERKSVHRK